MTDALTSNSVRIALGMDPQDSTDFHASVQSSPPLSPSILDKLYKEMDNFLIRKEAAKVIWRAWLSFRNRMLFKFIKQSLCRAELLVTDALLKRICPKEVELIKDPLVQARIRFRLGGASFPPIVLFKIYTSQKNVHYFSGFRFIETATIGDRDSCTVMGEQTYYKRLLQERYVNPKNPLVSDWFEVTNRKEYIQYVNSLDQRPCYLGGRNNGWRELMLEASQWKNWYSEQEYNPIASMLEPTSIKLPVLRPKPSASEKKQKYINKMRCLYGFENITHSDNSIQNNNNDNIANETIADAKDDEPEDEDVAIRTWANNLSFEEYISDWDFLGMSRIKP